MLGGVKGQYVWGEGIEPGGSVLGGLSRSKDKGLCLYLFLRRVAFYAAYRQRVSWSE